MSKLITKELNYDLSEGASSFSPDQSAQASSDKCTLEIQGTTMSGTAKLQVSVGGSSFTDVEDVEITLTGNSVSIPLSGITPGSYLLVVVSAGTTGTLSKVNYLFG